MALITSDLQLSRRVLETDQPGVEDRRSLEHHRESLDVQVRRAERGKHKQPFPRGAPMRQLAPRQNPEG